MANTSRMNRLEELGRVDAEKAYTSKGARNLKDEKKRIVRELKADGGFLEGVKKGAQKLIVPRTHLKALGTEIKQGATKLIKGLPKIAKKGWK